MKPHPPLHAPNPTLQDLIKLRDGLRETIDAVSERVEAQLDKGLSPHQDRKRLAVAQNEFTDTQGKIDAILKKQ